MKAPFPSYLMLKALLGKAQRGFALISTLMILALLVVVAVISASVAQVERKSAANSGKLDTARQNALFALSVALNQLQKEAGADQRVTARAEILNTANADDASSKIENPMWTGVWKSYNPAWNDNQQLDTGNNLRNWSTNKTGPVWLVSNPDNSGTPTYDCKSSNISDTTSNYTDSIGNISVNKSVQMASFLGHSINNSSLSTINKKEIHNHVYVPLVPIHTNVTVAGNVTLQTTGQYAYWVCDEGVKAKANMVALGTLGNAKGSTTNYATNEAHLWSPQANPANIVFTANDTTSKSLTVDFRKNGNVTSILTMDSLPMIIPGYNSSSSNVSISKTYSSDLTLYSWGVLSDVKNGGLKKDLTAAFEDDNTTNSTNQFNQLIISTGKTLVNHTDLIYDSTDTREAVPANLPTNISGLCWQSAYFYYNYYKQTQPFYLKATNSTASSGLAKNDFGLYNNQPYNLPYQAPNYNGGSVGSLSPIPIVERLDVVLASIKKGSNYTLQLQYYPTLVLYNPYSVTLTTKDPKFSPTTFKLPLNFLNNSAKIFVGNGNTTPYTAFGNLTSNVITNTTTIIPGTTIVDYAQLVHPGAFSISTDSNSISSFYPGEMRVFQLPQNYSAGNNINSAPIFEATNTNTTPKGPALSCFGSIPAGCYTSCDLPWGPAGTNNTFNYGNNMSQPLVGGWTNTTNPADIVTINLKSSNITGSNSNYLQADRINWWPQGGGGNGSNRVYTFGGIAANSSANSSTSYSTRIDSLQNSNSPYLLTGFNMRAKGMISSDGSSVNYTNKNYNLPLFMGNAAPYSFMAPPQAAKLAEIYLNTLIPFNNSVDIQTYQVNPTSPVLTSWGVHSAGVDPVSKVSTAPNSRLVLFDIPNQPLFSIGQLMHMTPYNGGSFFSPLGHYTVGGSFAAPHVPVTQNTVTAKDLNGTPYYLQDDSFMANQALFDSYFFSTVPPLKITDDDLAKWIMTNATMSSNITAGAVPSNLPLPNRRHRFYYKNGVIPTGTACDTTIANLRDVYKAAANLLVDGAFNVNSTSIDAWRVLLSSLSGNQLRVWNIATNSTLSLSGIKNPIPRFWSLTLTGLITTPATPREGIRSLGDDEVTELANQIVIQVKSRGPFLTMGDFLNRRLGALDPNSTLTKMGALQAAIENTTVGGTSINAVAKSLCANQIVTLGADNDPCGLGATTSWSTQLKSDNTSIANAYVPTSTATGFPGYLMQQDLVQAFAPVMTVRSDTFVIRCYGETVNPSTGVREGRAWGEAVVQRTPEFVDQSDTNITSSYPLSGTVLGDATPLYTNNNGFFTQSVNNTNLNLGRRFKLVSFRWLNQNEL